MNPKHNDDIPGFIEIQERDKTKQIKRRASINQ